MTLPTALIKKRLDAVSRNERDNEAQNIINGASAADLLSLDAEAVLMLYEALRMLPPLFYSARDQAAMKRLAAESQFKKTSTPDFSVNLVKGARASHPQIQRELTADLVTRIYAAEKKRLSWYEAAGVDGDTVGRGQLGQPAYTDIGKPANFRAELERCVTHVYVTRIINAQSAPAIEAGKFDSSYKFVIPSQYEMVWREPVLEDFVVAAYLAIRIESASKAGRSFKDTTRFAVARYHGMFSMVSAAQAAVKNEIDWAPVEKHLRGQGHGDKCDYVNEVVP